MGKGSIASHSSAVALYNFLLGNLAQAIEWWYIVLEIKRQQQDKPGQAITLYSISLIERTMGHISKARETVSQALNLSFETRDLDNLGPEFFYKAYYEFLLGNSIQAYQNFEIALHYEQKENADTQHLYSIDGNQQGEFLVRIHAWKLFVAVNEWHVQESKKNHWNDCLAVCHLFQGWYEISQGCISQAEKALTQAEHILRPSGMLKEMKMSVKRCW